LTGPVVAFEGISLYRRTNKLYGVLLERDPNIGRHVDGDWSGDASGDAESAANRIAQGREVLEKGWLMESAELPRNQIYVDSLRRRLRRKQALRVLWRDASETLYANCGHGFPPTKTT
jgi:hypothetical protein